MILAGELRKISLHLRVLSPKILNLYPKAKSSTLTSSLTIFLTTLKRRKESIQKQGPRQPTNPFGPPVEKKPKMILIYLMKTLLTVLQPDT
jgi:hypothetical protein